MSFEFTDEQKKLLDELRFNRSNYSEYSDREHFVIPFIAMNDGKTPAQIKLQANGLYKDIQRAPFLRLSGKFDTESKIPDLDITALVYYGTLEQSKIAPTLENIDIRLYYREVDTKRIEDTVNKGTFADRYVWREIPAGFHVYNNDTVYGYEWLVLQNDYSKTDGIYNLHMDIGDGLGVCKFAGTQSPIPLKDVQYKIIITAKNLWSREFSLTDSMPLIKELDVRTDELAPSVNAVRDYYAKALETLLVVTSQLNVGTQDTDSSYSLIADKDSVSIRTLNVGDISDVNLFLHNLQNLLTEHKTEAIDDSIVDENGITQGVHGIVNKGSEGNINAKKLAGLELSNGRQAQIPNISDGLSYIPYVAKDDSIGLGATINFFKHDIGKAPVFIYQDQLSTAIDTLLKIKTSEGSEFSSYLEQVRVGTTILNLRFGVTGSNKTLKITSGRNEDDKADLQVDRVVTNSVNLPNGFAINVDTWSDVIGSSSIAVKNILSELLPFENLKSVDSERYRKLKPNIDHDVDGNPVDTLDTKNIVSDRLLVSSQENPNVLIKLKSALQALRELPLSTWQYKRGQSEFKDHLGILVERVNQLRDHFFDLKNANDGENYLTRNINSTVSEPQETETTDLRATNNVYTYTDDEIDSIVHYLNLVTSKQELASDVKNMVGILLVAAKETQDRLLDLETSIFGWDAKTIPGDQTDRQAVINELISEDLRNQLNNSSLLLGLNRLVRAICLEVFDTTDLEKIDSETTSVVTDSDTLGSKVTIKSRLDQVDDITAQLFNQITGLLDLYIENVKSDESRHTYTQLEDVNGNLKELLDTDQVERTELLGNIDDDHSGTRDRDVGQTWVNLPTKVDIDQKEAVSFAQVAESAHKHTPDSTEVGVVRIPELQVLTHTDIDENITTDRVWNTLQLNDQSYKVVFKSQAVAWESAKLERLNLKVSELTKAVYGTDDVVSKLPNRMEVLRRNITNLVDELYPNRDWSVEQPINVTEVDTLYLPYKKSKTTEVELGKVAQVNEDENNFTFDSHVSLLHFFNSSLFTGVLRNNYLPPESFINTEGEEVNYIAPSFQKFANISNSSHNAGELVLNTKNLKTDSTNDFSSYSNIYSHIDLLEDVLGLEDMYLMDFFEKENPRITNIFDLYDLSDFVDTSAFIKNELFNLDVQIVDLKKVLKTLQSQNADDTQISEIQNQITNLQTKQYELELSEGKALTPNYRNELKYQDFDLETKESKLVDIGDDLQDTTNISTVLSRKAKKLQARVTTLEAFADTLSKSIQYGSTSGLKNRRFEKFETQPLRDLFERSRLQYGSNRIFDLDLSESFNGYELHNDKVLQSLNFSINLTKTTLIENLDTNSWYLSYYKISGIFNTDLGYLPYQDSKYIEPIQIAIQENQSQFAVNIYYVKPGSTIPENFENLYTSVFLIGKELNKDFYQKSASSEILNGSQGWQNQTESNIYKAITTVVDSVFNPTQTDLSQKTGLYYQLMLKTYPVGSTYLTFSDTFNPNNSFGGKWVKVEDDFYLRTGVPLDNWQTTEGRLNPTGSDDVINSSTGILGNVISDSIFNIDTNKKPIVGDYKSTAISASSLDVKSMKVHVWVRTTE